jgi:hypothetical protein
MLTDNPLTEVPDPPTDAGVPGERLRRLERRRRLVKEEVLAVAVLLVLLAATVVVLATQWLASGPSANASGVPAAHVVYLDTGGTT